MILENQNRPSMFVESDGMFSGKASGSVTLTAESYQIFESQTDCPSLE